MAGAKKARKRSLAQQLGTVGTDPFIPARQPYSVGGGVPSAAGGGQGPRRMPRALACAVAGIALAGVGVWGAFFARSALAASVRALHVLPSGDDMTAALALAGAAVILGLVLSIWGSVALRRARLAADIDAL